MGHCFVLKSSAACGAPFSCKAVREARTHLMRFPSVEPCHRRVQFASCELEALGCTAAPDIMHALEAQAALCLSNAVMPQPQAGSFSNAGSGIAQQASSFAEAAATSATEGLLLDLDTLWSFVQEARPWHTIRVHERIPHCQTPRVALCTQTCGALASVLGVMQGVHKYLCH